MDEITACVKIDTIAKIAAEVNGGKQGDWRWIANFAPFESAGNTRAAAELANMRRE